MHIVEPALEYSKTFARGKMDLVLEVCDSYIFDNVYAKILPTSIASHVPSGVQSALSLNKGFCNATFLEESLRSINNLQRVNKDVYGYTPYLMDFTAQTFGSILPRSNLLREFLSLWVIVTVFGWLLYLLAASLSYVFVFDRSIFNHPRYLKNQMSLEIKMALSAIPIMSVLTVPWFLMELHGHSRLYMEVDWENHGMRKIITELISFLFFTDCGVYLAHRWLHWPRVYKALHKPHHKWLVCTPFASHAFDPVDGYLQSISYHIYPVVMPLNKVSYLCLFTFVNFWTVMIHDGQHMYNNPVVNGTACHTVHHLYFNYNYGQFTTLWDRLGGTYRRPEDELFDPSLRSKATMEKQIKECEEYIKMMDDEGDSYRVYGTEERLKKVN